MQGRSEASVYSFETAASPKWGDTVDTQLSEKYFQKNLRNQFIAYIFATDLLHN
jgi:hypothetical protein